MNSPKVTVVICTCDRYQMLVDALESVRRQTQRAAIARVVVSENSLSEQSRSVCTEFKDLPLVYVQQRPPIAPLLHLEALRDLVETPLMAILHDDDWWAPRHLESALDALQADEECVAVYSSFFETFGPRGYCWLNQSYYFSWLAAGGDFSQSVAYLDPASVMLSCLINVGLHYSTVVGRTDAMWDASSRNIARKNAFDNDRTFPVFLSRHGSVGYVTAPEVFVRNHPFRDAWTAEHLSRGHMVMAQATTRWLLQSYPEEVAGAAKKFKRLAEELGAHDADAFWHVLRQGTEEPQWSTLVRECGLELPAMKRPLEHSLLPGWLRELLSAVCPPVLYRWALKTMWKLIVQRRQALSSKSE